MALKEIQIKSISELPLHQRDALRDKVGKDAFNQFAQANALVEIKVASSTPHIDSIEPIAGTFSERLLANVNDGEEIEDIFNY